MVSGCIQEIRECGDSGMNDEEYSKAIYGILSSGRGYKAIADLIGSLEILNDNTMTVMKGMKSERNAIKKICECTTSYKEKVRTVMAMME